MQLGYLKAVIFKLHWVRY